jgi:hypothetical protein
LQASDYCHTTFLSIFSYYVALYSLIFEIAKMVFCVHCANPCTARTGTLVARCAHGHCKPKLVNPLPSHFSLFLSPISHLHLKTTGSAPSQPAACLTAHRRPDALIFCTTAFSNSLDEFDTDFIVQSSRLRAEDGLTVSFDAVK